MNAKYVNSLPLYRIEQEFSRNGVNISRQVMAGWIIRCCEKYLAPMYGCLKGSIVISGEMEYHNFYYRLYILFSVILAFPVFNQ